MRASVHFVAIQQTPLQSNGALHLFKVVVTTGLSKQIQTFFCKISKLRCSAAQSFLDRFSSIIGDCDLSFRLEVNFGENGVMNNFGEKKGALFYEEFHTRIPICNFSLQAVTGLFCVNTLHILNNALPQFIKQRNRSKLAIAPRSLGFPPNRQRILKSNKWRFYVHCCDTRSSQEEDRFPHSDHP